MHHYHKTWNIWKERESVARRKREWFPGAMYHIMHQGVRRFKEDIRSVASISRRLWNSID